MDEEELIRAMAAPPPAEDVDRAMARRLREALKPVSDLVNEAEAMGLRVKVSVNETYTTGSRDMRKTVHAKVSREL